MEEENLEKTKNNNHRNNLNYRDNNHCNLGWPGGDYINITANRIYGDKTKGNKIYETT